MARCLPTLLVLAATFLVAGGCRTEAPTPATPSASVTAGLQTVPMTVSTDNITPITTPVVLRVRPFECQRVEVNAVIRLEKDGDMALSQHVYTADVLGVGVGDAVATTIRNAWVQGREEGRPHCSELPMTRMLFDSRGEVLDATIDASDPRSTVEDIQDQVLRIARESSLGFAAFPEGGVRSGDILSEGVEDIAPLQVDWRTVALGRTAFDGRDVLVSETSGRISGPTVQQGTAEQIDYHDLSNGVRVAGSSRLDLRLSDSRHSARLLALVSYAVTGACAQETDVSHCAGPQGPLPQQAVLNSCRFAFDGDCDEPVRGTGLCTAGTDTADCSLPQGPNSCQFAFDGTCDHPAAGTGRCPPNTDQADCRSTPGRSTALSDSCEWAFDGECDESRYVGAITGACLPGTDTSDCRGLRLRSDRELAGNTCQWAFDGECDERGIGTGLCMPGTDSADCRPSPRAGP